MASNDNDSQEGPPLLASNILLGVIRDDERETFVSSMTEGAYAEAGELASIGIVPGILKDGRAGLYLSFGFANAEGNIERVEVGRVTYGDMVNCMAGIVRCLHDADLLKYERGGPQMQRLLDLEIAGTKTTVQ